MAFECTNVKLFGLSNYGGGIQVQLQATQRLLCFARHRVKFDLKPRTNENTTYNLTVGRTTLKVTGTVGGMTSIGETDYVALSEGAAEVTIPTASKALSEGEMAVVGQQGITVVIAPKPTAIARSNNGQIEIITHPTNRVIIDGVPIRRARAATIVIIETLSGERKIYGARQWPKGNWMLY